VFRRRVSWTDQVSHLPAGWWKSFAAERLCSGNCSASTSARPPCRFQHSAKRDSLSARMALEVMRRA